MPFVSVKDMIVFYSALRELEKDLKVKIIQKLALQLDLDILEELKDELPFKGVA